MLCDRINTNNIPKFIQPRIEKSMFYPINCKLKSQTDIHNNMNKIDPLKYFKRNNNRNATNISDDDFNKKYNFLLSEEKSLTKDYYVVYNATTIEWVFYSYFVSFIRYLEMSKDMVVAPLFRTPNEKWKHNGKDMHTVNDVLEQFKYNVNNNVKGWADGQNSTYSENKNFDHYDWVKEHFISVNLALTGGFGGNYGESTLHYFSSAQVHTSGAMDKIASFINGMELSNDHKNLYLGKLRSFYDFYHKSENNTDNKDNSVLMQILIKKEIVDDVLVLTTPYGFPLPIKPSKYLNLIQNDDVDAMKVEMANIYNLPDSNFVIDGAETKRRMGMFGIERGDLRGVQGRFVPINEELVTTSGNIIINNWNSSGWDLNTKMFKLYEIILEMMADCASDERCLDQYFSKNPYAVQSYCSMM